MLVGRVADWRLVGAAVVAVAVVVVTVVDVAVAVVGAVGATCADVLPLAISRSVPATAPTEFDRSANDQENATEQADKQP